jgi:hypothetical protein
VVGVREGLAKVTLDVRRQARRVLGRRWLGDGAAGNPAA